MNVYYIIRAMHHSFSLSQGQALPPPVINPSLSGIRNTDLTSNSSSYLQRVSLIRRAAYEL